MPNVRYRRVGRLLVVVTTTAALAAVGAAPGPAETALGLDASVLTTSGPAARDVELYATVRGRVTDSATGRPVAGTAVWISGHAKEYSDVTSRDGRYLLTRVEAGSYRALRVDAPAHDPTARHLEVVAPRSRLSVALERDWAAAAGGAELVDYSGPDLGAGCGPEDALDLSHVEGWASSRGDDAGTPTSSPVRKYVVVRLPRRIDVSAFGVDPSSTCGHGASAATGAYRIAVSSDGEHFFPASHGAFDAADRGRLNRLPTAKLTAVRFVRFWLLDSQVRQGIDCAAELVPAGCSAMDLTELEVYGTVTPPGATTDVQLLSFNDYLGHLRADDLPQPPLPPQCTETPVPACTPAVGGVEYLAGLVDQLRGSQPEATLTVAAGDLIGGSTLLSSRFQDQPSIESLNALGLDVSAIGDHELDEGLPELRRIVDGGCFRDSCFTDADGAEIGYGGTDFDYLAANVVDATTGRPVLPATSVRLVDGIPIGFIGLASRDTPSRVDAAGIEGLQFLDEVETANQSAAALQDRGVETIVVLLHTGGPQTGPIDACDTLSGPVMEIATQLDTSIDLVVSGDSRQAHVCSVDDPAGIPRLVTSAASWGQVLTETHLQIDDRTRDVIRDEVTSDNHLVTRDPALREPEETAVLEFWQPLAELAAREVVGSNDGDIAGDAGSCGCEETPMADLVADAILSATEAKADGGAKIALIDTAGIGGVFAEGSTETPPEGDGTISYGEAYSVAPAGEDVVSLDLTGAELEEVLNQQYQPDPPGSPRSMRSLGVSAGFTYAWTWEGDPPPPGGQPGPGSSGHVIRRSMQLGGVPIQSGQLYRVATSGFLADGGDGFSAFGPGRARRITGDTLTALLGHLGDHPAITAPPSRVAGL